MTSRRRFLAGAGGIALAALPARAAADTPPGHHGPPDPDTGSGSGDGHSTMGGANGPTFRGGARVDHAANGFDPRTLLREFDYGTVSTENGRTVRDWTIRAQD
ncbi:MAG: hypothetical protein L0H64_19790, partial [Pseudonocardia sp.]|nr:hypothetical protein [Pseudonocardia sp.]